MRLRLTATAGVLAVLAASGLVVGGSPASADTGSDLYVNWYVNCSDSTTDSAATPSCTIQAAADVAEPGQTVHVYGDGDLVDQVPYPSVDITRSGTPGHPITFDGLDEPYLPERLIAVVGPDGGGGGFAINGAHDIALRDFDVWGSADGVSINNSTDITADSLTVDARAADGFDLTGTTSNVTISRSSIGNIDLAGNSSGSVIENNVLRDNDDGTTSQCDPTVGDIAVSAGSTTNTISDYNVIYGHDASDPLYNWNATAYTSLSDFTAATGQGKHDINADPGANWSQPGTVAINSADANAPGELSTDFYGNPRVDDPLVPSTGTGPGDYDRGAIQPQDPLQIRVTTSTPKGPFPLPVTLTASVDNPWSDPLTYTFDFGDGTAPVTTSTPSVSHTYTAASPASSDGYLVTLTATAANGTTMQDTSYVDVVAPAPLVPAFYAYQDGDLTVGVDASASSDSWPITSYVVDWGDGTSDENTSPTTFHGYAAPGTYVITMTETDSAGRTGTVSTTFVLPSSRALPIPVSGGGHCKVCY